VQLHFMCLIPTIIATFNESVAPISLPSSTLEHVGKILVMQVAGHPAYKVLTLRTVPQIAQDAVKYTTFTWNAILKRLLQMFITSSTCPDSLDWSSAQASPNVAKGYRGGSNKSAGSFLVVRGLFAPQVDVSAAVAPHYFPAWNTNPLQVVASKVPFRGYEMCSTLLSSDKVCIM
jgi:tubulin delta